MVWFGLSDSWGTESFAPRMYWVPEMTAGLLSLCDHQCSATCPSCRDGANATAFSASESPSAKRAADCSSAITRGR